MTAERRVLVLNPNSSESVTRAIDRAVQATPAAAQCRFETVTASEGPSGVITQEDYARASLLVGDYLQRNANAAQAFVIACFSDPGLLAARNGFLKPVIGLGESGLRAALALGRRVGVVAVADAAIPRHLKYWDALGLRDTVAGECALNLRVDQSGDPKLAFGPMCAAARRLRDEDGADVLLLGCAGMADLREPLQQTVGLPVVDPCHAAAQAALAALSRNAAP
jgi:allantoin racemase